MDRDLAEIFINNLIKNAVRHNIGKGFIHIRLSEKELLIENSGTDPQKPTSELFEQFSRASDKGFMGIGLAIVKKIIEHYHMKISYDYQDGVHRITVVF